MILQELFRLGALTCDDTASNELNVAAPAVTLASSRSARSARISITVSTSPGKRVMNIVRICSEPLSSSAFANRSAALISAAGASGSS